MFGFEVLDESIDRHITDCLWLSVGELVSALVDVFKQISNCGKSLPAQIVKIVRSEEYIVQIVEAAPDPGVTPKLIIQNALWKRAHRCTVKSFDTGLEVAPEQQYQGCPSGWTLSIGEM